MNDIDERLKDISEIRSLMEQSSKFLSLSGLSGVSAGIVGTAAAVIAEWHLRSAIGVQMGDEITFFVVGSIVTLAAALALAAFFSVRMTNKKGLPIWTTPTRSLLVNLLIPLAAGGAYCLILLMHGFPHLIAPAMLIFYGLALMNASKYTLPEIRYLGLCELCLGLIGSWWVSYGLMLWGIGFGLLHIIYGALMYVKYEK